MLIQQVIWADHWQSEERFGLNVWGIRVLIVKICFLNRNPTLSEEFGDVFLLPVNIGRVKVSHCLFDPYRVFIIIVKNLDEQPMLIFLYNVWQTWLYNWGYENIWNVCLTMSNLAISYIVMYSIFICRFLTWPPTWSLPRAAGSEGWGW